MRFWDSSAIVPLLVHERSSPRMHALLSEDPAIAAAFITPIEVDSALWRKRHAGFLAPPR
jgi:predicted nucleic acid-binding protein